MSALVFTNTTTPRLQYIVAFVSDTFFNKQLQLTNNSALYQSHSGFKINYSAERISASELHIQPVDLLFEKNITQQIIECFDWQGLKVFFRTGGDISFDIFAATFYLISRYEEYLPHAKDEFGRYAHINSLAFREHFLHLPLVNMWWNKLLLLVSKKYQYSPQNNPPASFQFIPTYDVDIAFSYKAKGFIRAAGGLIKAIRNGNIKAVNERIDVLAGKKKDPFDTFEWLCNLHNQHHLDPVYFFLLAEKNKAYDKNNLPHAPAMKQLIAHHADCYSIGIHPSWQSNKSFDALWKEIKLLHHLTGKRITKSRQHYIKMILPQTCRLLTDAGITHDYSMGYGSTNGFRASATSPFYWYDVERDKATHLLLHPFCYMDANAIFEQQLTPEKAAHELEQYCAIVKEVNGNLITIFHNHFLTEQPEWLSWRKVYEVFLNKHF
ncbi:hypothetical protein FC093_07200 [Ilyomonas limi]|uniref:DUF7033 domain-containing protein n=1 Tax=Ilyomonas limi TaxID=2575867 RepID=A0A4U3L659_9BACT|nr:polysaccharide deacetylase family protein [Ilyomonas limi]TKK69854.1 hypothetical protein FC093_07200 [Ilyomonas limi]